MYSRPKIKIDVKFVNYADICGCGLNGRIKVCSEKCTAFIFLMGDHREILRFENSLFFVKNLCTI